MKTTLSSIFLFLMKAKSYVVMPRNARWGCKDPANVTVSMLLFWKWRPTYTLPPAESFTWLLLRSSRAPPKVPCQESVEEPSNVLVILSKFSTCAIHVQSYCLYTVLWRAFDRVSLQRLPLLASFGKLAISCSARPATTEYTSIKLFT